MQESFPSWVCALGFNCYVSVGEVVYFSFNGMQIAIAC